MPSSIPNVNNIPLNMNNGFISIFSPPFTIRAYKGLYHSVVGWVYNGIREVWWLLEKWRSVCSLKRWQYPWQHYCLQLALSYLEQDEWLQ